MVFLHRVQPDHSSAEAEAAHVTMPPTARSSLANPTVVGKRLISQDVYILTSGKTWSAAENFCYALKQLKRATLIGERTAGGAHSGRGLTQLTPLFSAFIPVGRSISPVTKSNWERIGVEPDVTVPAAEAVSTAHIMALRRLLEKEPDEVWRRNIRETIADLTAERPNRQ